MTAIVPLIVFLVFLAASHLIAEHIGEKRKIGYDQSFIWSFLFSPVIGLIVTLLSKKLDSSID